MNKQLIKKIGLTILGVMVLLSGELVYHIYSVTRTKNDFRTSRQLSRIDFTPKLDSVQATHIRYFVAGLEGIESTYFNYSSGILVYTFNPTFQSSNNVYDQVMKQGKFTATKYTVDANDIAKGCPAIDKNSFGYKTSNFVTELFKK